jgi:hypothetical protein
MSEQEKYGIDHGFAVEKTRNRGLSLILTRELEEHGAGHGRGLGKAGNRALFPIAPLHQIWIAILMALLFPESALSGQWKIVQGKGYVVCEQVRRHMSSYQLPDIEAGRYGSAMLYAFPVWKEPPWQDLDPEQHKELVRKLMRYKAEGADLYFDRHKYYNPQGKHLDDGELEQLVNNLYARKFRLRVWRTHLFNIPWDNAEAIQTVVQLRIAPTASMLSRRSPPRLGIPEASFDEEYNFIVTDDLLDPDIRVGEMDARSMSTNPLRLFSGKPYWIPGQPGSGQSPTNEDPGPVLDNRSIYTVYIYRASRSGIDNQVLCIIEHSSPSSNNQRGRAHRLASTQWFNAASIPVEQPIVRYAVGVE